MSFTPFPARAGFSYSQAGQSLFRGSARFLLFSGDAPLFLVVKTFSVLPMYPYMPDTKDNRRYEHIDHFSVYPQEEKRRDRQRRPGKRHAQETAVKIC